VRPAAGFKSDDAAKRERSPYFRQGKVDGALDAAIVRQKPPGQPNGMDPNLCWSVMYRRGYAEMFGSEGE
jgi:hypothetical protein